MVKCVALALLLAAGCTSTEGDPEPPAPAGTELASVWIPSPGATWQWQLTGTIDLDVEVEVFDVDGFDTGSEVVDQIHAGGGKAICYLSVGAWEDWRPDAVDFPESVIGEANG